MRPSLSEHTTPLPLQQSESYAAALQVLGRNATVSVLGDAGQALVIARKLGPLGNVRFTSRGPIWKDHADEPAKVAALKTSGLHLINATAEDVPALKRAGYRQIMTAATVACLSVETDGAAQLSKARGKWRNAARKCARQGLKIRQPRLDDNLLRWLLQCDARQQRDKGYRALPAALTRALVAVDPAAAHLLTATSGNRVHAAMLFLRHGAMASYHLGWSDPTGRAANAHHAMLMRAADVFATRGVKVIDLGLVDTDAAPGLARFKIGSGATVTRLGGTWLRLKPWRR